MKNKDSCMLLADAILKALARGSTVVQIKDIGIPETSFSRYLRNPLFDYVKGTAFFTIKWSGVKIQSIYNEPFARIINFNDVMIKFPGILNCALKLWTSPPNKGLLPDRVNYREQAVVKMKRRLDLFWKDYQAALPIENPMFHLVVKPVIMDEAPRRLTGNSLLVQYNIRPNLQLETS